MLLLMLQLVLLRVHFELLYSSKLCCFDIQLHFVVDELCGPFMGAEFGFGSKPS